MKQKLGLVLLLGAWLGGCATEPAPLNRTQPEAVNKAMFTGEWIYKMTVTDTDWDNDFTFTGEETSSYMGGAFKVRWEITQDLLAAYLIPQRLRDKDGNLYENEIGSKSMVLAFPIKSHYDIRYRYNSTTREDLNVIEENTDRPWNEREYMEVDWTQNRVTNMSNPTIMDITMGNITREPVTVTENFEFFARGETPDKDYRIDTRKWNPAKDPEVYVMNIDTKETLTTTLRDWYQLYYGPYVPPVTTKIRHSLLKADPVETIAAPRQYGDDVFRRFGFFRTEFETYDAERGPLESQKAYYINRWDLSGDKKVVWTASPQFQAQINAGDELLKGAALRSIEEWNKVLAEATGRTDTIMSFQENTPLLDAEGNPVYNLDGSQRWKYEFGDVRYNFLNLLDKPQNSSPLGYGPSTPDSDTGEIKSATVNCYGNWIDFVVRRAMDQYDVAAGFCTLDQVKDGKFYNPATGLCDSPEWQGQYKGGTVAKPAALTHDDHDGHNHGADALHTLTPALMSAYYPKANLNAKIPEVPVEQREIAKKSLKAAFDWERKHPVTLDLGGFQSIAGTRFESMMVPHSMMRTLAPNASSPQDDAVVAALSPAARLSPDFLARMKRLEIHRSTHMCDAFMFEPAIHQFVDEEKDKPRDEVYNRLREWIWYTTILHEMGHTLGLRHNFRGSVDRENFTGDYWTEYSKYWDKVDALRSQYGTQIKDGDPSAYQAYVKAVDSIPSSHNRFGSTSIMDYMGDWVKWQYPVGAYDRAAILFGYGNKIEVSDTDLDPSKIYSEHTWSLTDYVDGDFVQDDPYTKTEKSASGRWVRFYHFCSDEKVFDDAFCTRFDIGTTMTEITRNFIRDAQPGYFFKNFKRHSAQFDDRRNSYYINKWLWTYLMAAKPLAEMSLSSIRYDEFWSSIWDGIDKISSGGGESRDMKPGYFHDGGEDLLRAQQLIYNYLLFDVLGRPDYSAYVLKYNTAGQRFWEQTDDNYVTDEDIAGRVPAGAGWGWADLWDVQADNNQYYAHQERIGVELDKIIALEILSIPAAFNDLLGYEKANGANFWNSLWTNNGSQLWQVIRGLITDNFAHQQNPWCMKCDAACQADSVNNPPQLSIHPVGLIEAVGEGLLGEAPAVTGVTRCGPDEFPIQPGMDALFAIYPIFFGIGGAAHPWYSNQMSDYMDSQVIGGNHQFTVPAGAETASFVNSTGTKEYLAAKSNDGLSISYELVKSGQKIKAQTTFVEVCQKGQTPSQEILDLVGRTCNEVLSNCYCNFLTCPPAPDWCDIEGWDALYMYDAFKYRNLDRVEAMLIMMQDMIDIAGHFAWRAPGYLDNDW